MSKSLTLDPHGLPSDNFDLTKWSLQLPVNSQGEPDGTAAQVNNLTGYQNPDYFFTGNDGRMVFVAPVTGATTRGSNYTRSELRETTASQKAAWLVDRGGSLYAELEVTNVPNLSDGTPGGLIVAQVHGHSNELCRLYYDRSTISFVDDHGGPNGVPARFTLQDAAGQKPHILIDELFIFSIHVSRHEMTVDVIAGHTLYKAVDPIAPEWRDDRFYFKAGVYNDVASSGSHSGSGIGAAAFDQLLASHP